MPISPRHDPRRLGAGGAVPLILLAGLCLGPGRLPQAPSASNAPATKPPPLELDTDEPLLLDASAKPATPAKQARTADNSSCLVCHANFRKEALAASHASHEVSCTSCHGPSVAHRNDEANIIPPDIMISTEKLDAACARCHKSHDVEPRAVVVRFLEKSTGPPNLKSLVCTSCHGEHRLAVRTVRWDKRTGKLVARGKK